MLARINLLVCAFVDGIVAVEYLVVLTHWADAPLQIQQRVLKTTLVFLICHQSIVVAQKVEPEVIWDGAKLLTWQGWHQLAVLHKKTG